jgi:hypothetical protein
MEYFCLHVIGLKQTRDSCGGITGYFSRIFLSPIVSPRADEIVVALAFELVRVDGVTPLTASLLVTATVTRATM